MSRFPVYLLLFAAVPATASAATIGPPMLDIAGQCDANSGRNTTAMSECVVKESEARSAVLQKWNSLSDADAERCIKQRRKNRRLPYTAIANCVMSVTGARGSRADAKSAASAK